jgi:hypothetical protein
MSLGRPADDYEIRTPYNVMNIARNQKNAEIGKRKDIEIADIEAYAKKKSDSQTERGTWGGIGGGLLGLAGSEILSDIVLNSLLTVGTGGVLNPMNPMTQLLLKGSKSLLTGSLMGGGLTGLGAHLGTGWNQKNIKYDGPALKYHRDTLMDVDKNLADNLKALKIQNAMTGMQLGGMASGGLDKLFGGGGTKVGEEVAGEMIKDQVVGTTETAVAESLKSQIASLPKNVANKVLNIVKDPGQYTDKGVLSPLKDFNPVGKASDVIAASADLGNQYLKENISTLYDKSYLDILKSFGR